MPFLWLSIAFIAGLILGNYLSLPYFLWPFLAAASLVFFLTLRRVPFSPIHWLTAVAPRLFVPPILLLTFLALGAWRINSSGPDLANGHVAAYNELGTFRITAVVEAPPDRRDQSTLYQLRVEQVTPIDMQGNMGQPHPAHGLLLALVAGRAGWQYGDRLNLDGNPVTPPEEESFSYRAYLARKDIYTYVTYPRVKRIARDAGSPLMAAIYRLRDWAYAEVIHLYPAPEGPLLAGILLGIDSDLPEDLARAFQDTGTAHIIAISGFNIAILAELFSKIFGKIFSRWWAMIISILVISGYTILVGATASVVRAAIMGSLALVGHSIGRRSAGANTLALTAALMCFCNPHLPWDASFQLSFGATLGLILYGERLQNGFTSLLERKLPVEKARGIAAPVGEYVLMTLAAQVMTLPAILYHFGRLSVSSLLANPLALPPQPLVMVLSGAAVLVGAVSDPLAHALAWLAWPLSAYTNRLVEALARIPGGVVTFGEMNLGTVALLYAIALAPALNRRLPQMLRRAVTPTLLLVLLGLTTVLAWRGAAAAPDGKLRLVIFDINGSQALLLRGPTGETILVNGGPSARSLNAGLDRWLSPFDRRLDGLLITTSQASTLSGLSGVLETHPVQAAWWGADPPTSRTGDYFIEALQDQGVTSHRLAAGESLAVGKEVRVEVLETSPTGSALRIQWGNFRTIVPGGIPIRSFLPEELAQASVLILEPRDLETTQPDDWLALAPQAVIATPENSAILPEGTNWLNTHPGDWYAVITDGKQMWVEKR